MDVQYVSYYVYKGHRGTIVGSIPTTGSDLLSLLRAGNVEWCHSNVQKVERKVGNVMFLHEVLRLCYMQDTA